MAGTVHLHTTPSRSIRQGRRPLPPAPGDFQMGSAHCGLRPCELVPDGRAPAPSAGSSRSSCFTCLTTARWRCAVGVLRLIVDQNKFGLPMMGRKGNRSHGPPSITIGRKQLLPQKNAIHNIFMLKAAFAPTTSAFKLLMNRSCS